MRPYSMLVAVGVMTSLTLVTGCSAGAGGFVANDASGQLAQNIGVSTATYQVVDLDSGAVSQRESIPDLTTDPAWRSSRLVFRRVSTQTARTGAGAGELGAQTDESAATLQVSHFYIAVFELTQAQWQRLSARAGAASTPWTAVTPSNVVTGTGDHFPAWGLSRQLVEQALSAQSLSGQTGTSRLALPTQAQWETAARAGTSTAFWWGDDPDETTVASRARVAETNGGGDGPAQVGTLAANPLGLYDVAGNVWELTADGALRGGSWHDTVLQARSANRVVIDTATAHALVGVRPILIP